jgi:hypothetical protein
MQHHNNMFSDGATQSHKIVALLVWLINHPPAVLFFSRRTNQLPAISQQYFSQNKLAPAK